MTDQTNQTNTQRYGLADVGCYIDGWWGQYATARLVQMAVEHGWVDSAEDEKSKDERAYIAAIAERDMASIMGSSVTPHIGVDDFQTLADAADACEQWLNEARTTQDVIFHWHDGELFLSPWCGGVDGVDDCDNDDCACHC